MRVNETYRDDVVVMALSGRFMAGADTYRLHDRIRALVKEGAVDILLDFADVDFLDSAGIGLLVSSHFTLAREGGSLKVCGISERVRRVLCVCLLQEVIETHATQEEALAGRRRSAAG